MQNTTTLKDTEKRDRQVDQVAPVEKIFTFGKTGSQFALVIF